MPRRTARRRGAPGPLGVAALRDPQLQPARATPAAPAGSGRSRRCGAARPRPAARPRARARPASRTASTSRLTHGMPSGSAPATPASRSTARSTDTVVWVRASRTIGRPAVRASARARRTVAGSRSSLRVGRAVAHELLPLWSGSQGRISCPAPRRPEILRHCAASRRPDFRPPGRPPAVLGRAVSGGRRRPVGHPWAESPARVDQAWHSCARFAPGSPGRARDGRNDGTCTSQVGSGTGWHRGTVRRIGSTGLVALLAAALAGGTLGGSPSTAATTARRAADARGAQARDRDRAGVPDAHRPRLRRPDARRRPGPRRRRRHRPAVQRPHPGRLDPALGRLEPRRRRHADRLHQRPLGRLRRDGRPDADAVARVRLRHGRRQAGRGRLQPRRPHRRRRRPRQRLAAAQLPVGRGDLAPVRVRRGHRRPAHRRLERRRPGRRRRAPRRQVLPARSRPRARSARRSRRTRFAFGRRVGRAP